MRILDLFFVLTVLVKLEANSSCAVFFEGGLLVLDLVNVLAGERAQLSSSLQKLEQVKTALSNDHHAVPRFRDHAQLERVRQVVGEGVPHVEDDADQLKPRLRAEGKLGSAGHHLQELRHRLNPLFSWVLFYLWELVKRRSIGFCLLLCFLKSFLSLLFKHLLLNYGNLVLAEGLLELGEVQSNDVIENTTQGRVEVVQVSLRASFCERNELNYSLKVELFANPEELVS